MSTINYKGFQASVHYEDGMLFIKVLHINDLLIATCRCADEVDKAFRDLIEEYLQDCAEAGKEPEKPFSGTFNVRVDKDLHRRAAMAAADADMSLNSWIGAALSEKLSGGHVETRVDSIFRRRHEELSLLQRSPFSSVQRLRKHNQAHQSRERFVLGSFLTAVESERKQFWDMPASTRKKLDA